VKVFVIDDSLPVRERLHELLAEIPGISLVAHMDQACDPVKAVQVAQPDVVILDFQLLNARGIEILEALQSSGLPMVKIMLTAFPHPLYRQRCLEAGVNYFLDKTIEFERILEVLNSLTILLNANTN
jgi:DNA-binding NarL/FixJ family response regulator